MSVFPVYLFSQEVLTAQCPFTKKHRMLFQNSPKIFQQFPYFLKSLFPEFDYFRTRLFQIFSIP